MANLALSEEHLRRAAECAEGLLFGATTGTVQYRCIDDTSSDASATAHHQVFEAGRLVRWHVGEVPSPDLCLRQSPAANLAMLTRTGLGDDVMCATKVVDTATGAEAWPPPLDEVRVDWGVELPIFVTVGQLTVEQTLTQSPFGDVTTFFRLDQGRIVACGVGRSAGADIVVERLYRLALLERAGAIDLMDSVEGGSVDGEVDKVSVFLGGYGTDECIDARRRLTTPQCAHLVALADVLCSRSWGEVAAALATDVTDRPELNDRAPLAAP